MSLLWKLANTIQETCQLYKKRKTLLNFLEEILASFGNSTTLQEIDHVFTLETSQNYPGNLPTLQLYKKKKTLLNFLREILASFGNSTTLQDLDHVFTLETGQHYPGNFPTLQLYKKITMP